VEARGNVKAGIECENDVGCPMIWENAPGVDNPNHHRSRPCGNGFLDREIAKAAIGFATL
jgi:hypothetical protein